MKTLLVGLRAAALCVGIAYSVAACTGSPGSDGAAPRITGVTTGATGTSLHKTAALASVPPSARNSLAPSFANQSSVASTPAGTTSLCRGAANTPDGPDPWGGCWPGSANTGVPSGTQLVGADFAGIDSSISQLSPYNTGWEFSTTEKQIRVTAMTAVIDGISDSDGIYVPAGDSLTVKNSKTSYIDDEGTSLTVENSTLNGGNQWTFATINGGSNITVESSDLFGGEHEVICYNNCTVKNSWLHDNANGAAAGVHQDGFLADGGSSFDLTHNSIYCTGGCTADISFLGTDDNATVTSNLLIASPDAAYCVYPGPNSSSETGINNMVWENNVFQEGDNRKCAIYGPVDGWFPSDGSGNIWSGNIWVSGAAVAES